MDKFKCAVCSNILPNDALEDNESAWCPFCEGWVSTIELTPLEIDEQKIGVLQRCPFCGCAGGDNNTQTLPDSDQLQHEVFCDRCERTITSLISMEDAMTCWNNLSLLAAKAKGFTVPTEPYHGGEMWDITETED